MESVPSYELLLKLCFEAVLPFLPWLAEHFRTVLQASLKDQVSFQQYRFTIVGDIGLQASTDAIAPL